MAMPSYPPRPSGSALSHTVRFLRDPFSLYEDAYRECGPIFSLRLLGLGQWVFLCSPEASREYYRAPQDVLVAGEVKADEVGFMFGRDATFSLDGPKHNARQRLVMPHLNGPAVLRFVESVREATNEMIDAWPLDKSFPLLRETHRLSLQVLMRAILGDDDPARIDRLVETFEIFSSSCMRSPLLVMPFLQIDLGRFSPWGRILRLRGKTRDLFRQEIELQRVKCESAERRDLLSFLIQAKQPDSSCLGTDALLDELLTLLFAGHETTGVLLACVAGRMISNPEVLAEIRRELMEVGGVGPVASEHLRRLKYLEAAICEGIRMARGAAHNSIRLVKKPFRIGKFEIPPGRVIAVCFDTIVNRDDLYPDSKRYDPSRFLDRKSNWDWKPFGHGSHICLGKGLAEMELKIALATILRRTDLRLATDEIPRMVRQGVLFAPENGMRVILKSAHPRCP